MTIPVTSILPRSEESIVVIGDERGIISILGMDGTVVSRLEQLAGAPITSLAVSQDGALLMASNRDGGMAVWKHGEGEVADEFRAEHGAVQCLVLAPHNYVTVARSEGTRWSASPIGGVMPEPIAGTGPVPLTVHAVAAAGNYLLLLSGFTCILWDHRRKVIADSFTPVDASAFLYTDGDVGISAGGKFFYIYWDDFLLFDVAAQRLVRRHPILTQAISTTLSGDGQRLAIGGRHGLITIMGVNDRAMIETAPANSDIVRLAITSDAGMLGFIDTEGNAGVIAVETGDVLLGSERIATALEK